MFPRLFNRVAKLSVFLAALIGFGMGCTMGGDAGIDPTRMRFGLLFTAALSLPLLAVTAIIDTTIWCVRGGWRPYLRQPGFCPDCDYVLPLSGLHTCPECGAISEEVDRQPLGGDQAQPGAWMLRRVILVLMGCLAAQLLALLEEQTTRWLAPSAFAQAIAPDRTDVRLLDNGRWSTQAGMSCRTRFGWVDWHTADGRTFRPFRWTPWPHLGDIIYLETPSSSEPRTLFYWFWMD